MPDNYVFVPVDPKGYGCGILLGLIIRYWKELLISIVLLVVCASGVSIVQSISSSISDANQRKESATQSAEIATREALSYTTTIARLKQKQIIYINEKREVSYNGKGYYIVESVEFEEDRFMVNIDLDVIYGGLHERSCIRYGSSYAYDDLISPIENHFVQLSDSHYKGYQVYNYSGLKPGAEYKFSPECNVSDSTRILLFQIP